MTGLLWLVFWIGAFSALVSVAIAIATQSYGPLLMTLGAVVVMILARAVLP